MSGVKRKCKFNDFLANQYPFLKKANKGNESDVFCSLCSSTFSIGNGGKSHIESHIKTVKHKNAVLNVSKNNTLDSFRTFKILGKKEAEIAAAEGVFCFHTVKHTHSLRSMDCLSKVLKKVLDPSFSSARTKSQAIIENVFAKYAKDELITDLQKASYVSIFTDSSNHKDIKVFPLIVRFFSPEKGIQVKLLDLDKQRCETSDVVNEYVVQTLKSNELLEKVLCFCADNTNTNFGGADRRGVNNVFTKLQESVNHKLFGVGCAAHIINNTIQTAADVLPIDIEAVLVKIYTFFHIYTVRVEELKDYCNYVSSGTEYQQILGYCKTRWLSLLPAIERLISMFQPLKGYFLSQNKCPSLLKQFFENKSAMIWIVFLQMQAKIFYDAIKQVEGQNITVMEVCSVIQDILRKYEGRIKDSFVPQSVKDMLEEGDFDTEVIKKDMFLFYETCENYLRRWASPFTKFLKFTWVNLNRCVTWEDMENCPGIISAMHTKKLDENQLYDEFLNVREYCSVSKIQCWNTENFQIDKRWVEMFCYFQQNNIPHENIKKFVESVLCLPGTNAPTERVFSAMNKVWTSEKNTLDISMLRALLMVKMNIDFSCTEFYEMLMKNEKLLKMIRSSSKYSLM